MNQTKVFQKNYEKLKKNSLFLPVFYLIMCLMKAPQNLGKINILNDKGFDNSEGNKDDSKK